MKKIVSDRLVAILRDYVVYIEKQGGDSKFVNKLAPLIESLINITKVFSTKTYLAFGMGTALRLNGAEQIIKKSLSEDMMANVFYKDIYKNAKKKVELFAELHGQSEVLNQQLLMVGKPLSQE